MSNDQYFTVYKITNTVNGKIYIGCHKTNDLDDSYMGSGKLLKRAQAKHGIENFTKEYIYVFNNSSDMFEAEAKLVTEDFISRSDTYNLKQGGHGGFDHISKDHHIHSTEHMEKMRAHLREKRLTNPGAFEKQKTAASQTLKRMHDRRKNDGDVESYKTFKGKTHTTEAKRKIGEANSIHQKGKSNSVYGTMWIYNSELKQSKRISKDTTIPSGWKKGRKIKFT